MYERTQDPNHPRSLRGQSRHRPPRENQLFRDYITYYLTLRTFLSKIYSFKNQFAECRGIIDYAEFYYMFSVILREVYGKVVVANFYVLDI